MEKKFVWKAQIVFEGTAKEFDLVAAGLAELPVRLEIPEWIPRPRHLAGCNRIPIDVLLEKDVLKELTKNGLWEKIRFAKDINGGIRTAHLHIGDEVVFLEREQFAIAASKIAEKLAGIRAAKVDDYVSIMDPINSLADDPMRM